jgi:AdoMet-dependent heme synthase
LITLASNGLAIDYAVARELVDARVAIVTLSLDGPDAKTHDACRGREGAFHKLMAAAENLRMAGMPIWFTAILTRQNAQDGSIFKSAELARRLGAVFTVNWAYAIGKNWINNDPLVTEVERDVFQKLMKMPHVRWEGSTNFRAEGCPAGTEKIYVTPYGDVFPCAIIQSGFGNLLDEPIAEIWERVGRVQEFDGRAKQCLVACDARFIREHFEKIRQSPGGQFQ